MDNEAVTAIKDAIRSRNGVDCDKLTMEDLHEAGCTYFVAPIPEDFSERLQYLGDMLAQMCMNHKVEDDRLRLYLRAIATAFSYMLNSSSFRDGELHGYDAMEIASRLRHFSTGENDG